MSVRQIHGQFPEKMQFLFEPHRYKVAYGGRGGAKSRSFAAALLILGRYNTLRILCARETQDSITDSVHALLEDQIEHLGLQDFYEVQDRTILGKNGTNFIFYGLKHNVGKIKSVEACDIVWVEEAQVVSNDSWETLIPTIRKMSQIHGELISNSEIWVSFNPKLSTDDTYQRFVITPPSSAKAVEVNYLDNPWFGETTLPAEMMEMKERKFALYEHIYLGKPVSEIEGAIYAAEIKEAETEHRITTVPYDATRPVETFWDLGMFDKTAIWFAQSVKGRYHIIDFLQNERKTIEWYMIEMENRSYRYGTFWLPWDGLKRQKLGSGRSIEEVMRTAGKKVRMVTMIPVRDGINAARSIFPLCRFDHDKCRDGIQALRHYQWGPVTSSGNEPREPLHNWACHSADAWRYLSIALKHPQSDEPDEIPIPRPSPLSWLER